MHSVDNLQVPDQSLGRVRDRLFAIIEHDGAIAPGELAQVHRTIDELRAAKVDPAALSRMESISCILWSLPLFRRQGRVNAHASALLRLRRAASAL